MKRSVVLLLLAVAAGGCSSSTDLTCPRVIFLDGAGWVAGSGPVRTGLKDAGYPGVVERFGWSSGLGAPLDYAIAGPDLSKTQQLAERIEALRRENPDGHIVLMGLSSGTAVIIYALEKLPASIQVNEVVLLSSSLSGRTDLREALRHVRGKMYVTTSSHDEVLGVLVSSLQSGEPAGREGFTPPIEMSMGGRGQFLYDKIVYIPWREEYADLGWSGGHTSVVSHKFIETVIAPKIMLPEWLAPRPAPLPPAELVEGPGKPASRPASQGPAPLVDRKAAELLKTLFHGDDSDRRSAARDLKKYNIPPVISGLIDALLRDGSEDVRREAAVSLGELNARDAQPALRKASREDHDSGVRKAALKAAVRIEEAYKIKP